jgi:hypothetical protein
MPHFRQIPSLCLIVLICGCSSFNKDYQRTAAQPAPATQTTQPHQAIIGAWEGTWKSDAGHGGGKLYAIVMQKANNSDYPVYHVRFRAHFWGWFKAEYDIILRQVSNTPLRFKGEHDLGLLAGGVYEYEATVTTETFNSTYKSGSDHGVFTMTRAK